MLLLQDAPEVPQGQHRLVLVPELALVYGVVSQVSGQLVDLLQTVGIVAQSQVALRKHVHLQWLYTFQQHPLPNIKLPHV